MVDVLAIVLLMLAVLFINIILTVFSIIGII